MKINSLVYRISSRKQIQHQHQHSLRPLRLHYVLTIKARRRISELTFIVEWQTRLNGWGWRECTHKNWSGFRTEHDYDNDDNDDEQCSLNHNNVFAWKFIWIFENTWVCWRGINCTANHQHARLECPYNVWEKKRNKHEDSQQRIDIQRVCTHNCWHCQHKFTRNQCCG